MISTTVKYEILTDVNELIEKITESEPVQNYVDCYYKLKNSREAQEKIANFVNIKDKYEEVKKYGTYHPDYKKTMNSIMKIKRDMDLDKDVANFKKAETTLQSLLDNIGFTISRSISEQIKVDMSSPLNTNRSSCQSNCSC